MINLKQGDCLELMKDIPDGSVDLIITDPPYKITSRGNGGNSGGMFQKKIVNKGQVFNNNDVSIKDYLGEFYRMLKPQTHCYIMTNNKNITEFLMAVKDSDFHFVKNLIWVKDNKIMGQSYMSQFEYIIFLRKGSHKRINNCGDSDVLTFSNKKLKDKNGKTIHDTEKPVGLMKILIDNSSQPDDLVLDPFMGIGSTGVACANTGRNFIGMELEEKYFKIAEHRIMEEKNDE
jgi:site-specific DNA-methyltransferase (adenine-specific)